MRFSGTAWRAAAIAAAALAAGATAACNPGSDLTAAESDVVATLFDDGYAFGSVQTYAMPDSIVHFTEDPDDGDSPLLSRDYDAEILAKVAAEFDALGWTRVSDPNTSDVVALVGATASVGISAYSPWYGYWGWYYPYSPGWGWYYPYPVVSYDYTLGTLVILLTDPDTANPSSETYTVPWVAAVNGVLDDTVENKRERFGRGITQAFDQSPYLTGD